MIRRGPEERASILSKIRAEGWSWAEASRKTDIPAATLRVWAKRERSTVSNGYTEVETPENEGDMAPDGPLQDETLAENASAAAVWVDIGSVAPWDQNPRINSHAVDDVAKSIGRFGFGAPLLARKSDRVIIAGHTRLKAALQLGLDKVPVRFLDLDPAEARALALADNKLGELAEWDDEALAAILRDLDADGASTDGLGWTDEELAELLGEDDEDLDGDGDGDDNEPEAMTGEYAILISCDSELHQRKLLEKLAKEDIECRAWSL